MPAGIWPRFPAASVSHFLRIRTGGSRPSDRQTANCLPPSSASWSIHASVPTGTPVEKEQFAYEVLLNKFDVMLENLRTRHELPNQGLVIHDRRVIAERDIRSWTSELPIHAPPDCCRLPIWSLMRFTAATGRTAKTMHTSRSSGLASTAEPALSTGCVHYSPSLIQDAGEDFGGVAAV
jgi:hypothetical protein